MVPCYESIGVFSSLGEISCNYAETRRFDADVVGKVELK